MLAHEQICAELLAVVVGGQGHSDALGGHCIVLYRALHTPNLLLWSMGLFSPRPQAHLWRRRLHRPSVSQAWCAPRQSFQHPCHAIRSRMDLNSLHPASPGVIAQCYEMAHSISRCYATQSPHGWWPTSTPPHCSWLSSGRSHSIL